MRALVGESLCADNETEILSNGSLVDLTTGQLVKNYCLDWELRPAGLVEVLVVCASNHTSTPECLSNLIATFMLVNMVSGTVSCLALILTALVYIKVKEHRK